jgi:hypothetical protein
MLRIRIEVLPASGEAPRVVETVRVVHVTEDERGVATYGVTREGSDQQHTIYHRRAEGALKLARLALGAALGEGIPSPEGWVTPEQQMARERLLADFEADPETEAAVEAEMREAGILPSDEERARDLAFERARASRVGPFGEPPPGCSCGCGATREVHCWRNSDWAEPTAAALPAADPGNPEDPRDPDGDQGASPGGQNTTLSGLARVVDELTAERLGMYRDPHQAEAVAGLRFLQGERDGLAGLTPGGTSPDYMKGFREGQLERAHRRRLQPGEWFWHCRRCGRPYRMAEAEEHLKC